PFPQNRQSGRCVYPTNYVNSDVVAAYALWKRDTVTADGAGGHLRVKRTSSDGIDMCRPGGSTVSEGIAYGMLIAVYMDDQALFDGLWLYEQQNLDGNGLMNWAPQGAADGGSASCTGAATDADEDMAFALVMADKQWGGQGTLPRPYKQAAVDQIGKIWANEIFASKWIRSGDGTWATNTNVNPSYFAPAYYRVFRAVDPDPSHDWNAAISQAYSTLADALNGNGNQNSGLVPAWCDDSSLSTCRPGTPGHYQYDSCRTPFRIGLDWCWNGHAAAQSYVQKTSTFFSAVGVSHIADGYALDGTPRPEHPGQLSAAFVGPAAIGAMSSSVFQSFLDDAYGAVSRLDLLAGGAYYEDSWTVLSLLMMTGNFIDLTAY
ncbi:MAG: glycosyl hydrolase family 8, partial [Myxococcota bacterium]|nr:glycosyl hydrolase family 8 [Myxococcota bacterium]